MKKKKRDVFLDSKANAWFERNHEAVQERVFGESDSIILGRFQVSSAAVE